ncbi:uncharacterized protein PAC_11055 [Phialocephala subalpina]|uniref:CobW/HypB/UreG nucleotide-binding domain-containing protein n=1 Tax=Phialocephala subalpina TaxID=576137 RepID=A0A1L7X809_9HELO|nr:uncharacterized protein PAC_11055 [Phialocephala subalpina]
MQYILIESTGITKPMQVTKTFTNEFSRMMIEQEMGMVDSENQILKDIAEMGEFLLDRYGKENIIPEDERTITDLTVEQLEFADVIMVNKIDMVDAATKTRVLRLVKKLNPVTGVIEAKYSAIDVKEIINTVMFSFEKAATGAGWLRSLHEHGISSFIYRARRPFHPNGLRDLIYDKFIVMQNANQVVEGDEEFGDKDVETDEDNGKEEGSDTEMGDVIEEKEHPKEMDSKSQGSGMLTLSGGGSWFCIVPRAPKRKTGRKTKTSSLPSTLIFWLLGVTEDENSFSSGEKVNQAAVSKVLDECLLTDGEMKRWEKAMGNEKYSAEEKEDKLNMMFKGECWIRD